MTFRSTLILAVAFIVCAAGRSRAADGPRVRMETIRGETIEARLKSIGADGRLVGHVGSSDADFALEDLASIDVLTVRAAANAANATSSEGAATSAPAGSRLTDRLCQLSLADGSRITGRLCPPEGTRPAARTVWVDIGLDRPIAIPFSALAAIRFARLVTPDGERELQARLAAREAARDLLIVPQADKIVVLPGALERLTPEEWEFRFASRSQTSSLDRAYAVVFGSGPAAPAPLPVEVQLAHGGNTLRARIVSATPSTIRLDAGPLGELNVGWEGVARLMLHSGRVVYVTDLKPTRTLVRNVFDADWPPQAGRCVTGGPLTLGGRTYDHGIGVHAATTIDLPTNGEFERFLATVGIDDSVRPNGSVSFRVLGDGRELYRSETLTGSSEPQAVSVDLTGVRALTLECGEADGLDLSDHADWADARLIRKTSKSVAH